MPFDWSHPEFRFHSARHWEQVATEDDLQLQLFCRETGTSLTLSMDPHQFPPEKFESVARFLLESRKKTYVESFEKITGQAAGEITYSYEKVAPHSSGAGYEITFEALHHGTSFIGFSGYVTARKVVNLFVETPISYAPERRKMFVEVLSGFGVTLP